MFEKPLDEQQQWEVETGLAERIDTLHRVRIGAAIAEQELERQRRREAEVLQEIKAYRKRLGLPDTPIASTHEASAGGGAS